MPLTATDKFEIRCRCFRVMTGHWPPGKDWPSAAGPRDEAADRQAWDEWNLKHGEVIGWMFVAFEKYEAKTNEKEFER